MVHWPFNKRAIDKKVKNMSERIKFVVEALRSALAGATGRVKRWLGTGAGGREQVRAGPDGWRLIALCLAGGVAYFLFNHPPLRKVAPGTMGIRINVLQDDVAF